MKDKELSNYVAATYIHYMNMSGSEMILKNNDYIPEGLGGRVGTKQVFNDERAAFIKRLEGISREDLVKGLEKDHYNSCRDTILGEYDSLVESE